MPRPSKFKASRSLAHAFTSAKVAQVVRPPLSEADAVDIWIARWIRVKPAELVRRYNCDPRRLYEIWEETRFAGSRSKALETFRARYPGLDSRIDPGPHRRIPMAPHPAQMSLFGDL